MMPAKDHFINEIIYKVDQILYVIESCATVR